MSEQIIETPEIKKPLKPKVEVKYENQPKVVKARATRGVFIDLVMNVTLDGNFRPVEMHPWLQAQVNAGLVELE